MPNAETAPAEPRRTGLWHMARQLVPTSVASRVYIICVLFVLFCISIVVWPLVHVVAERQARMCAQQLMAHTDLVAQRIDAYLAALLTRPADVLAVHAVPSRPTSNVWVLLDAMLRLDSACESVALVAPTGTVLHVKRHGFPYPMPMLHTDKLIVYAIQEGAQQVSRIVICSNTHDSFVEVAWPATLGQRADAALWLRFNLRYVRNMLATSAVGARGHLFISDERSLLLATATHAHDVSHTRSAADNTPRTLWGLPLLHGTDGEEVVAVTRPLPSTGWTVTLALPTSDVLQPQYRMMAGFGLIVLAILLAGAALSLIIAHWLTEPVRTLSAAAQAIGNGQFDTVVPTLGRNEFGMIADALNAMVVGIRERTEAIWRAQAYLTGAIDSSPLGIVIAEAPDVRVTTVNRAAAHILGVLPEQPGTSHTMTAPTMPWSWPHLPTRPLVQVITQGITIQQNEVLVRRADGGQRVLHINAAPIRDQQGVTVAGVLIIADVTEHVAQQRAVEARDRLLASTAQGLSTLLQATDTHAAVPGFLEALGLACDADRAYLFENHTDPVSGALLMSQRYEWCRAGVTPQIDNPQMQNLPYAPDLSRLAAALQAGQAFTGTVRDFPACERAIFEAQDIQSMLVVPVMQKDFLWGFVGFDAVRNERQWTTSEVAALRIAGDCLGAAIHRSETTNELAVLKERLATLLRSIPLPVFAKDAAGRYIFCNAAFTEFFGVDEAAVIGKTVQECWSNEDAAVFHQKDMEIMAQDALQVYEHQMRNAQGDMRHVIYTKACFHDARGAVAGIVGTMMDITDRSRAEMERLALERQMQHAQKLESLGVLAGGIAHDFNNMLMAMLGNLDLAQLTLTSAAPAWPYIEEAQHAARRAADLTRQMLAYSGKGHFEIALVDVRTLIEETMQLIGVSISKRATVQYNFDTALPPVRADATQVRQVIMNLITNASEALGDAGGAITVGVRALFCAAADLRDALPPGDHAEGMYIEVAVDDTGCGMDAATCQRVFDPFFTTKMTGRGLGMAAVLGIVRGHRGALHISSSPGRGTCVRVLFPAAAADGPPPPAAHAPAAQPWQATGVVLVVDDETNVRTVTARMVKTLGFDVLTAENGDQALAVYAAQHAGITAVILDYTMPGRDGYATLLAMRAINPTAVVIISSGFTQEDVARNFLDVAPDAYIQKPFTVARLREALRAAMQPPAPTTGPGR
jgi:PAS domain S-box-containing protein